MKNKSAIVIGAGIVGLATARALAVRGCQVKVFERHPKAQGASVRNFGMLWPIGQPSGKLYERALRSRSIWKEMINMAKIWHGEVGSLHLAYRQEELHVIEEFKEKFGQYQMLSCQEVKSKTEAFVEKGLMAALWSNEEMIIDPREAIAKIPDALCQKYGVDFHWHKTVTDISYPRVKIDQDWNEADLIFVCSGPDFETLYPTLFQHTNITKCKLQMMRLATQPKGWRIGPALCGGLTLVHYNSFKSMDSHAALVDYYEKNYPEYLKWGLNVMVSQNGAGELTIGDSHEYGLAHSPFNLKFIDDMILKYLATFAHFKDWTISEHWNGIYPKMKDGSTELVLKPENGVTIINGLGGAGMTLSFGLAEEIIASL